MTVNMASVPCHKLKGKNIRNCSAPPPIMLKSGIRCSVFWVQVEYKASGCAPFLNTEHLTNYEYPLSNLWLARLQLMSAALCVGRRTQSAIFHLHRPVKHIQCPVIVRDYDHTCVLFVGDLAKELHDLPAASAIQGGSRLIGQDQAGAVGKGPWPPPLVRANRHHTARRGVGHS